MVTIQRLSRPDLAAPDRRRPLGGATLTIVFRGGFQHDAVAPDLVHPSRCSRPDGAARRGQGAGRAMAAAGHRLYLVSGSVRDALLAGRAVTWTHHDAARRQLAVLKGDAIWKTADPRTVGAAGPDHRGITTFRADAYHDRRDPQPGRRVQRVHRRRPGAATSR